uniref:Uncharacterized protein n=1 Tax=Anopheles stephensi TaxID=30069 RepID=A0A182YTH4_ANOST
MMGATQSSLPETWAWAFEWGSWRTNSRGASRASSNSIPVLSRPLNWQVSDAYTFSAHCMLRYTIGRD